ncbi:MAG: BON domain-containing protein [Rhodocyclaceae bacterium]|nr:BON domain-containing protein [Rhodocyclaceae bacterium]
MKQTAMRWLGAAAASVLLAACAATPTQESTGQYVDDATITGAVKSAFVGDDQVGVLDVGVDTSNGVVQLSGFANSAREKARAEELARSVKGVKDVENDIRLK